MLNRSIELNLPQIILRTIYGKERTKLLIRGSQVIPMRTLQYGYKYKYGEINKALDNILKN